MKKLFEDTGCHAAKWDLTDFYEDEEKELMEAIYSGEDFTTGWYSCSKEIRSGEITRMNGKVFITVSAAMDDLYDDGELIGDALYELGKDLDLPDDFYNRVQDRALDCDISDHVEESDELPGDSSYEDIMSAILLLEHEAETSLDCAFEKLCEIIKELIAEEKEAI